MRKLLGFTIFRFHMGYPLLGFLALATSLTASAHPLTPLIQKTRAVRSHGVTPVFLFDIDETLVDSAKRYLMAYKSVLPKLGSQSPGLVSAALQMQLRDFYRIANLYDPVQLFAQVGIHDSAFIAQAKALQYNRYLSGAYLEEDTDIPGSVTLIKALRQVAAEIFFISSRYQSTQGAGTIASLRKLGFIENAEQSKRVILRPDGMSSLDFKKQAFATIRRYIDSSQGRAAAVGVFENEPENIDAMVDAFPEALPYFIDGACINCQPTRSHPVHMKDFL